MICQILFSFGENKEEKEEEKEEEEEKKNILSLPPVDLAKGW